MQIKIMGFGTFDGIHPGHLNYLNQLKKLGDKVFIIIARDANVEKIKGHIPKFNENKRIKEIVKTKLADKVLLGDKNDFYKCIRDLKPEIIGLGYDQKANINEIKKMFPNIKIKRLKAFKPEKHKSSILRLARHGRALETRTK